MELTEQKLLPDKIVRKEESALLDFLSFQGCYQILYLMLILIRIYLVTYQINYLFEILYLKTRPLWDTGSCN